MGIKAKALGNVLANRLRGFENKQNQMENPSNMQDPSTDTTTQDDTGTDTSATSFEVPSETLKGVEVGDVLTVEADDGTNVTLTKQPETPDTSATSTPPAPPIQ
jgi:hypothetical protein